MPSQCLRDPQGPRRAANKISLTRLRTNYVHATTGVIRSITPPHLGPWTHFLKKRGGNT